MTTIVLAVLTDLLRGAGLGIIAIGALCAIKEVFRR